MKYTLPDNFPIIKIKVNWEEEWERFHLTWFDIFLNINNINGNPVEDLKLFPGQALLIANLNTLEISRFLEVVGQSLKGEEYQWVYFELPFDSIFYRQYGKMKYRVSEGDCFVFDIKRLWA